MNSFHQSKKSSINTIIIGILFTLMGVLIPIAQGYPVKNGVWINLNKESSYFIGIVVMGGGLYTLIWGIKNLVKVLKNSKNFRPKL